LKTYELEFIEAALKEWHRLDGSVRAQFKKQLAKRLLAPHVASAKLSGDLHQTYKIKLRNPGYRLVYEVLDRELVILVVAIGRRDHDEAYLKAAQRLNN
jgi:mRNA interferase RelE/StbE